jgi:tetratricopeptide (TPR) repeat protein
VLVPDKDPRARIEIPAGGLLLGRAVLPPGRLDNDPAVSASHARIIRTPDGGLVVSDLGSTNGTYVNGMRIVRPQPLRQGDTLQLGQSTLRVEGAASHSSTDDPSALLSRAKQLLREGKTFESEAAFRGLLDYPNYASEGHYGLGVISFNRSDLDAAVTNFEQCLRADPQHANALYQLGFIAERQGLMNDALEYYRSSLSADPQHGSAKLRLAVLQRNLGSPPRSADPQTIRAPEPTPNLIATPSGQYGVYEYLQQDAASISRQAIALMDKGLRQ